MYSLGSLKNNDDYKYKLFKKTRYSYYWTKYMRKSFLRNFEREPFLKSHNNLTYSNLKCNSYNYYFLNFLYMAFFRKSFKYIFCYWSFQQLKK